MRVLDAFAAWLQQGVTSAMDGAALAQSPLVLAALKGLQVGPPLPPGLHVPHLHALTLPEPWCVLGFKR